LSAHQAQLLPEWIDVCLAGGISVESSVNNINAIVPASFEVTEMKTDLSSNVTLSILSKLK
jgi:hypothetical protein